MPIFPNEPVYKALLAAAREYNVPVTLLMGVAFAESSFDPTKVGPITTAGNAKGLMQLTDAIARAFGVTDPFDPRQSARAGARLLAELGKAYAWDPDKMLAGYVWGVSNVNQGKPWPYEVTRYITRVKNARLFYETQGKPVGATQAERIAYATKALDRLNPSWAPAQQALAFVVKSPSDFRGQWANYNRVFPRAPVTDPSTPAPSQITPDTPLQNAVKDAKMTINVAANETGLSSFADSVGEFLGSGVNVLLLCCGVFLLAHSRSSRRS